MDHSLNGRLGVANMCKHRVRNNTNVLLSVPLSRSGRLGKLALRALSGSIIVKVVKVALRWPHIVRYKVALA